MKTRKIFNTSLENAFVFYSVFRSCGIFSATKEGKLVPVYDFSGNGVRSTLNSLRSEGFKQVRFHFGSRFVGGTLNQLPTPYFSSFTHCYVYF